MNSKNLRRLFILGIFLLIVIIIVAISIGRSTNNGDDNSEKSNSYSYNFDETVNLDNIDTDKETIEFSTDSPDYGVLNEYYDNTEYYFDDRDLYVQTYDGRDVISEEWRDESYGELVDEPEFGTLEKFILSQHQASARYNDVKMKDVDSYIKKLKENGFDNVVKDLKNSKADIYIFSAKKGENTVTLNYEKGSLLIVIF